jgi:hypothetical protein
VPFRRPSGFRAQDLRRMKVKGRGPVGRNILQTALFCVEAARRPPAIWQALQVAGLTGFGRLLAAISVRNVRGMSWRPTVVDA